MSLYVNNNGDYVDVDIYIDRPDIDWLFRITLVVETGEIYGGETRCGTHPDGDFDDTENKPPADVLAELEAKRPEALAMLAPYRKPDKEKPK